MSAPAPTEHKDACRLIDFYSLHCSMSQFRELEEILQKRALSATALDRMADNAAELGLDFAVEMRIMGETK